MPAFRGHFSVQGSAVGGLSYKVKKIPYTAGTFTGICIQDPDLIKVIPLLQLIFHISGHIVSMVRDTFQVA